MKNELSWGGKSLFWVPVVPCGCGFGGPGHGVTPAWALPAHPLLPPSSLKNI